MNKQKLIDQTINVNCKAPVLLTQLCIPYMEEGSRILQISPASAMGYETMDGRIGQTFGEELG